MSKIRFIGLDVHADSISVAIAEPDNGEVRSLGAIPNQPEHIRKLVRKLGPVEQVRACYEAGPTGYGLYWQLTELAVACDVIAPTLTPTKPGESRQDEPPRCGKAGALPPCRRSDTGVGPGCRARSIARFGARARGWQTGSTARAASVGQVPLAPWQTSTQGGEKELDPETHGLDPARSSF